jgi:hypothetical protein
MGRWLVSRTVHPGSSIIHVSGCADLPKMGRNARGEAWQPINRPARGLRARRLVVAIAVSHFRLPAAASALFDLHFHQPFFLQFRRRKWAFLLLVSVGPTVVRRCGLKLTDRAGSRLARCGAGKRRSTWGDCYVNRALFATAVSEILVPNFG